VADIVATGTWQYDATVPTEVVYRQATASRRLGRRRLLRASQDLQHLGFLRLPLVGYLSRPSPGVRCDGSRRATHRGHSQPKNGRRSLARRSVEPSAHPTATFLPRTLPPLAGFVWLLWQRNDFHRSSSNLAPTAVVRCGKSNAEVRREESGEHVRVHEGPEVAEHRLHRNVLHVGDQHPEAVLGLLGRSVHVNPGLLLILSVMLPSQSRWPEEPKPPTAVRWNRRWAPIPPDRYLRPVACWMNTEVVRAGTVKVPVLLLNVEFRTMRSAESACTGCSRTLAPLNLVRV
jgi:hypothetical protein